MSGLKEKKLFCTCAPNLHTPQLSWSDWWGTGKKNQREWIL